MDREHYDKEAERRILECLLQNRELVGEANLKPEYFSAGPHKNLYLLLAQMYEQNLPFDITVIFNRVKDKKDHLGGITYVAELLGAFVEMKHFDYYMAILIEHFQFREKTAIGGALQQGALDLDDAMDQLQTLQDIAVSEEDDDSIGTALVEMYDDIETADGTIKGVRTGFREIDKMTGGLKGGDFVVVGARPSIGKTAFAINIANNAMASSENENGDLVLLFSAEMKKKILMKRFAGTIGNIDMQKMKTARIDFDGRDWASLTHAMAIIHGADLKVVDTPNITSGTIRRKIRKHQEANPGRRILVIIDYLQLLQGNPKLDSNRQQQISQLSRELKVAAMEFDVPIIALSQLSRGLEQRQEKRPMMSDLRESGAIEQDADIITFLYREDYYDKETEDKNMIEVIIAKHRDGPTGTVKLAFIKEYGKFVDIDWGK